MVEAGVFRGPVQAARAPKARERAQPAEQRVPVLWLERERRAQGANTSQWQFGEKQARLHLFLLFSTDIIIRIMVG